MPGGGKNTAPQCQAQGRYRRSKKKSVQMHGPHPCTALYLGRTVFVMPMQQTVGTCTENSSGTARSSLETLPASRLFTTKGADRLIVSSPAR